MIELDGEIEIIGAEGDAITLTGEGSRLRADVGAVPAVRPTLRLASSGVTLLRRLAKVLARRDLTLLVTRSGVPVIELGAQTRGGVVERLFGLPRVRLFRRK